MNRAFVKETDDLPDLPDRPISAHPNIVTERGLKLIEAEVARWQDEFARVQADEDRQAIAAAARELRYWTARRASAQVEPPPLDTETVRFGSRVTIERDDGRTQTFGIVGEDEADPAAGLLSYVSPLAAALMGRSVGEVVRAGQGEAEVLRIEAGTE
jgi:transcription elongation GreA/GreB family factor